MSNKVYDVLKWIALVFLPAFIVLVGVILNSLNVANANIIITILTAIDTFLGSILGISNINYNKKVENENV
nr:MAG TPA: holin [Caudoviricetes sp.]